MRLHRSAYCLIITIAAMAFTAPARANVMIIIDKSTQKMSVTVDGEERYVWPVSTGRAGYDTPSGEFQPFRMERDHFSREWDDAPMPNSIFFTQIGHAIHGTFEARNLGRPVSHGCVRLSTQNAATLYALVKDEGVFNTRVRLVGAAPKIPDQPVARRSNGDRTAARARDNDRDTGRDRNNSDERTYVRNYSTDDDDDAAANQPTASARQRWRDTRSSYYYRDPYYQRRYYYGRGLFTSPFGW